MLGELGPREARRESSERAPDGTKREAGQLVEQASEQCAADGHARRHDVQWEPRGRR